MSARVAEQKTSKIQAVVAAILQRAQITNYQFLRRLPDYHRSGPGALPGLSWAFPRVPRRTGFQRDPLSAEDVAGG